MDLDDPCPRAAVTLELRVGSRVAWLVRLMEGRWVVGRCPSCDLVIPPQLRQVSGLHLSLRLARGLLWVRDLGSKNGSGLDGRRVHGEVVLLPGRPLVLGEGVVLSVLSP